MEEVPRAYGERAIRFNRLEGSAAHESSDSIPAPNRCASQSPSALTRPSAHRIASLRFAARRGACTQYTARRCVAAVSRVWRRTAEVGTHLAVAHELRVHSDSAESCGTLESH